MEATNFSVIVENEEQVELSFTRIWDHSREGKLAPLNVDKRFVLLRGSPGFGIYEHPKEWPGFNLDNTRVAFKLRKDKFQYMVVADNRQRFMPLPDDRIKGRGEVLAYPEAVLLVNPVEPKFKGEVRINDLKAEPVFSSEVIGKDNTIARYRLFSVDVPGNQLVVGNNTLFLTQVFAMSLVQGIMYDYIRLEGPSSIPPNPKDYKSEYFVETA